VTKRIVIALALLLAAACSGKSTPPKASSSPAATRPPVSDGQVNRPLAGVYVYTLSSVSGAALPPGLERIETVSISGNTYKSLITDNKNANQDTFFRLWTSSAVELAVSDAIVSGGERKCTYTPPIKVVPIPLKIGKLARQSWTSPDLACTGTTDINVISQETVADAKGTKWSTWKIQEVTSSGGTSTQTHWFSPVLGADIRDQSTSPNESTLSVLSDYPS